MEDTNSLIEQRRAKLKSLEAKGIFPFQNKFTPDSQCHDARSGFQQLLVPDLDRPVGTREVHDEARAQQPYRALVVRCAREAREYEARIGLLDRIGVDGLADEQSDDREEHRAHEPAPASCAGSHRLMTCHANPGDTPAKRRITPRPSSQCGAPAPDRDGLVGDRTP